MNETNPIQPDEQQEAIVPDEQGTHIPDVEPAEGLDTTTPESPVEVNLMEVPPTDATADEASPETANAGEPAEDVEDEEEQADDEDEAEFRSILEALVFASDEPLTFKQMKELLAPNEAEEETEAEDAPGRRRRKVRRLTITRVKRAIDRLNDEFAEDGRVFRIVEVAGGFAFQTTKEYGAWVGRLFAERSRRRLTQSALETLAIIAFKQPISKPAIEGIRGVNAEYVVKSLLERNLISIVGREDSPGRPLLYGTTKNFLKHFGLSSINDLPKPREIKDLLSSEDELAVNPIDEMDPDAAALLTRVSSQELEKLFENAQTKAEGELESEAPVLHVQFDSEGQSDPESESGDGAHQRAEDESKSESDPESESGDGAHQRAERESESENETERESESESENEIESDPESESGDGAHQRAEGESESDIEIENEIDDEDLEPAPGDEVEPELDVDDEDVTDDDDEDEDEDDQDHTLDNDEEDMNR